MKAVGTALILLASSLLASNTSASNVYVHTGFLNGTNFLDLSQGGKMQYASGLVDGFLASPFWGGSESRASSLHACIQGMTNDQVAAIFEKYLRDNPQNWHMPMSVIGYNALSASCPPMRTPPRQ